MIWVKRLLLLGVVFLLPLVILAGAANLTARMPDFYQFEFNNNDVSKTVGAGIKNAELADFFSDFMWGKQEEFSLQTADEDEEEPEEIFLPEERMAMERLRMLLNLFSLAGAVAVLPVAAGYYVLIRSGGKDVLRRAFLGSIAVFSAYGAACGCALYSSGAAEALKSFFTGVALPEQGVLFQIFTQSFVLQGAAAAAAIAVVFYIIIGMVTWNLTKPYRMFHQERRGRG